MRIFEKSDGTIKIGTSPCQKPPGSCTGVSTNMGTTWVGVSNKGQEEKTDWTRVDDTNSLPGLIEKAKSSSTVFEFVEYIK
jgi:hypothetical protein